MSKLKLFIMLLLSQLWDAVDFKSIDSEKLSHFLSSQRNGDHTVSMIRSKTIEIKDSIH